MEDLLTLPKIKILISPIPISVCPRHHSKRNNLGFDSAARNPFDKGPWSRMAASDRGNCLFRLAHLVEKHANELAVIEAVEAIIKTSSHRQSCRSRSVY
jgi:acyl-CoA reductase-like NAD-dependent aldehyde dehydrogenase